MQFMLMVSVVQKFSVLASAAAICLVCWFIGRTCPWHDCKDRSSTAQVWSETVWWYISELHTHLVVNCCSVIWLTYWLLNCSRVCFLTYSSVWLS